MSNINQNFALPLDSGAEDFSILANFMKNGTAEESVGASEGELAIDVVQINDEVMIVAPMPGCRMDNIELHLHNDVLTIRGERQSPYGTEAEFYYRECYWGKFSRTIVLPMEVKVEMARAEFKNGVLTVVLPKAHTDGRIAIEIVEE